MELENKKEKEEKKEFEQKDFEENKNIGILSYMAILFLIPLLARRKSPYCQFHAKQGMVLCPGWFLIWIPIFGPLLGIILFIFSVVGIVYALDRKKQELPIVGELAKELAKALNI